MSKYPLTEDGTLFSTRQATPYRHDCYGAQIFKKAVARAGLPDWVTTHDLRYFFASELLGAGESPITVAERVGHNNASTILKGYAHVIAGQEDRTRRAIDNLWQQQPLIRNEQHSSEAFDPD